jgi:hypothetical protein
MGRIPMVCTGRTGPIYDTTQILQSQTYLTYTSGHIMDHYRRPERTTYLTKKQKTFDQKTFDQKFKS